MLFRWMAVLALAVPALAQDSAKGPGVYRVDLTVRRVDEQKRTEARRYQLVVEENNRGFVRAGQRIPILATPRDDKGARSYTYTDVGVNLDCRVRDVGGQIRLSLDVEITELGPEEAARMAAGALPMVQSMRSSVVGTMPPGKPALLVSMDDPGTQRRYEIEAVAVRLP